MLILKKSSSIFFLLIGIALIPLGVFCDSVLTFREQQLIGHLQESIEMAERGFSKLSNAVLDVSGYTSPKVKHFLNNLCSLPQTRYLEIGVWKGATFTAALYGNSTSIIKAVAIDNWSEFGGPFSTFKNNCNNFISDVNYQFYSEDSFAIDTQKLFDKPIDIYFYDGNHSVESQEKAFTYYDSILASSFIAIVDDWNWIEAKTGTLNAFKKLGYEVLFEAELPASYNGDVTQWWNGLYVGVIRRSN